MDDLISRQAALDAIHEMFAKSLARERAETAVKSVSSAQLEQRTGTWEERRVEGTDIWDRRRFYCSACGDWQTYGTPAFCPNCGADMRGDRHE